MDLRGLVIPSSRVEQVRLTFSLFEVLQPLYTPSILPKVSLLFPKILDK